MRIIYILLISIGLHASLMDFATIQKAKKAYENGDFASSASLYAKIKNSDEARFNEANSLYKQQKYKKALSQYESITDPNLEFEKLANIGNTQAQLKNLDDAIKSYNKALKIKKDKDIEENLELLKKLKKKKEEQKKKQKQKEKDKKKQKQQKNKNSQDKKNSNSKENKDKQDNKDKQKSDKKENNQQKSDKKDPNKQKQPKTPKKDQKQESKKDSGGTNQKSNKDKNTTKQAVPISDIEERKWQKQLNKKGVQTLLIPLNSKIKRSSNNENNNW